jgi:DNA recombination protein RmuC
MHQYIPFIITAVFSAVLTLIFIRIWLKKIEEKDSTSKELVEWMKDLGRRIEYSTESVDKKLSQNMEIFNTRLDRASQIIASVQKHIGEFAEMGKSMKELQEFLQSPKLRGNIGENILIDLLKQHFPNHSFQAQYSFKSGEKVDAVIKTSHGLIPIDSKFPIDNFRAMMNAQNDKEKTDYKKSFIRDVKNHIQTISTKYILTAENTLDYALMYIPSEAVYYEIINNADLFDFSSEQRVLPVSPLTFYAYMKAILMSFEGERIQKQAQEIIKILHSLQKDYSKSEDALATLTKHMVNAQNQLSNFTRIYQSLGQKIESTQMVKGDHSKI